MADKFYDGMPNVNEELNKMNTAFEKGPFNALPLTGGTLTGAVTSTANITARNFVTLGQVIAGDGGSASSVRAPNDSQPGVAGQGYEVAALGVAGIQGVAFPGRFYWSTLGGALGNLYATSYQMVLRAVDTSPASSPTAPLLMISGAGDLTVARSVIGNDFFSQSDNAYTVGTSARRFQTIYAATGTINTSDARLKCDFRNLATAEIAAARDIARAIGVYRWRDAVDCKGADAREHIGPTVQRAIEIMQGYGLNPFNYGFICYDEWEREVIEHPAIEAQQAVPATDAAPEVRDGAGNIITPAVPANPGFPAVEARAAYTEVTLEAGDRYAFRYDELAMFIAASQEARLAALEAIP